jgi:hypothetical protein
MGKALNKECRFLAGAGGGLQCEQCADAAAPCDGSQQAALALMTTALTAQQPNAAECLGLFRMLLGAKSALTVDAPELCELGCWEGAGMGAGKKTVFSPRLIPSMIVLPRQARDKQRGNPKKRDVCSRRLSREHVRLHSWGRWGR